MANLANIHDFKRNRLMKMSKEDKEDEFSKFLTKVKILNLDRETELKKLDDVRGLK